MTDEALWLLSTTVQSAAAVVAIVGGFLISRLIATASERRTLGHRRDVLQGRRELLGNDRERKVEKLLEGDIREFLAEVTREIAEHRLQEETGPFLDELLRTRSWPHDRSKLALALDEHAELVESALRALVPVFETALEKGVEPESLEDFRRGSAIKVNDRLLFVWEEAYEVLEDGYYEEMEGRYPERRVEYVARHIIPQHVVVREGHAAALKAESRALLEREIGSLDGEVRTLGRELEQVESALAGLRRPVGIIFGLAVLTYLSIVGIVWPLGLLGGIVWFHSPNWDVWLVGSVITGVVGLLAYLSYVAVVTFKRD